MNAGEITAEIHHRQAHGLSVPIIAITAQATRGEREHCLNAGASGYLSRPVTKDDLRSALARWGQVEREQDDSSIEALATGNPRPYPGSAPAVDLFP